MTREELKEKISDISNSEFPLIDFFNDIGWLEGSKWFNTEKAYEDIEKIYNVFVYYKDKVKKLEKENQELKEKFKMLEENEEVVLTTLEMAVQENTKLKKALEKSCEMLSYTCPVEKELIDDLDCENCKDNYKECWKKFF